MVLLQASYFSGRIVCFILLVIIKCKVSATLTDLTSEVNQLPFNHELEANDQPSDGRFKRLKRSAWSLPPNTTARFVIDYGIISYALNNTVTYLVYSLIFNFKLPTYQSIQQLYHTLGKLKEYDDDDDFEREDDNFDLHFYEEQRANHERRRIYDHAEEHLNK